VQSSSVYGETGCQSHAEANVSGGAHGWNMTLMPADVFVHSVRRLRLERWGGVRSRHDARCWVLRERAL
jgi:hypothetical protein